MFNFNDIRKKYIKELNTNLPGISDHSHRILIDSGSWKTNALLNLIDNEPDIEKIYVYAKDPFETKYHFLKKPRKFRLKVFKWF